MVLFIKIVVTIVTYMILGMDATLKSMTVEISVSEASDLEVVKHFGHVFSVHKLMLCSKILIIL